MANSLKAVGILSAFAAGVLFARYPGSVVVVVVDVVVGAEFVVVGKVVISAPLPVDNSVSDPVRAPGVALLAPD